MQRDYHGALISIHAPPRGATADVTTTENSCNISIHAPPRGATRLPQEWYYSIYDISIHAPPRGATDMLTEYSSLYQFQFTPLREGRHSLQRMYWRRLSISIHAPPRGATFSRLANLSDMLFQFTPLREGRRAMLNMSITGRLYFNSRPSARGDAQTSWIGGAISISIHAPPRGATG